MHLVEIFFISACVMCEYSDFPAQVGLCLAEMLSAESGGIVSRPNLNFEPAFDQESLSMAHTCLRAEPLDSHAPYVEGAHRYIRMGGKAVALGRPIVTVM